MMAIELHRGEPIADQLRRGRSELQSVREEAASIAGEFRTLAKQEVELAKAELAETVAHSRNTAMFGGVAALAALLTLVFAALTLMFVLDVYMPLWAAALITMGVLAAVTFVAALLMRTQFKSISFAPTRTIESISEDVRWARSQLKFNGK